MEERGRINLPICKSCKKDVIDLSYKRLCGSCGFERIGENIRQLRDKEGPYYEKWKKNITKSLKEGKRKKRAKSEN